MRRYLPIVALLVVTCAVPASAAVIIDPDIGVRGRDAGSQPTNTSAFFVMGTEGCPVIEGKLVFCFDYEIVQNVSEAGGVFSVWVKFLQDGEPVPTSEIFLDTTVEGNFSNIEFINGTARLFFPEGFLGGCNESTCGQGDTIQVYLAIPEPIIIDLLSLSQLQSQTAPTFSVSLERINDIPVPEPGLLLLMGIGLALAGRQLRRRRSGQPPASE